MPKLEKNGITYGKTKKVTFYLIILVMLRLIKFNKEFCSLKELKKPIGFIIES